MQNLEYIDYTVIISSSNSLICWIDMCVYMCCLKKITPATYFFLLSLISTQHVDVEIWVGVPPPAVCVRHRYHHPHVGYYSHCHEHQQCEQLAVLTFTFVLLWSIECLHVGGNGSVITLKKMCFLSDLASPKRGAEMIFEVWMQLPEVKSGCYL